MFEKFSLLKQLDVSKKYYKCRKYMFSQCSSLIDLNVSNFNGNKIVDIENMFENCSSFEKLDLSNFNPVNAKAMKRMFYECKSLKEIIFQILMQIMQ